MKCQEVMELMQRFLDLDLTEAEEATMQAHLQDCPECADLFERLQLLNGELAMLPKVIPPYSIVDSIMPKLEELGAWNEPSAAADAGMPSGGTVSAGAAPIPFPVREKKGWISWKIMSGVAAAGLVIGMFIFNMGENNDRFNADGLLTSAGQNKESSAAAASDSVASPTIGKDKNEAMSIANAADILKLQTTEPPGSAASAPSGEPSPAPESSKAPAAIMAETPRGNKEVAAAGGDRAFAASPVREGEADRTAPDGSPGEQQASGAEAAGAADAGRPLGTSSGEPAAEVQQDAGTGTAPEQTPSNTGKPRPEQTVGNPDPDAAGMLVVDPALSGVNKKGSMGFVMEAPEFEAVMELASLDGRLTGYVKEGVVVILDQEGAVKFTSLLKANPDDEVTLDHWTEDGKLTYRVIAADGTELMYQVDVKTNTETKL